MINKNSQLAQTFWETGKLGVPILDFHAHMHEDNSIYLPNREPAGMAATMDQCGTRWTLFCSHYAMRDPIAGEEYQKEAVHAFPNHFRAYHGVMAMYTDPDRHLREIEDNPDVYVGCKFLCDYYRTPLSDPAYAPYFEFLNEKNMLALLHTWGGSRHNGVDEFAKIVDKYPNVTFICGHSFFGDFSHADELFHGKENLYYELTAVPIVRGYIEEICEKAGSERLLFGSDLPWFATSHSIGCVLSADLTDEDRENIFWKNGDRILRRFPWYTLK